jgi:hypothetical protein
MCIILSGHVARGKEFISYERESKWNLVKVFLKWIQYISAGVTGFSIFWGWESRPLWRKLRLYFQENWYNVNISN